MIPGYFLFHFFGHAFELAEISFVGAGEWEIVKEDNFARKFVGFEFDPAFTEVEWLARIDDDLAASGVVFGDTVI